MTMVLALGTSMPVSMMVEHSSTLWRCATKSRITRSSSRSGIWPCAIAMRASGSSSTSLSRRFVDRLDLVVQEVDLPAALQLAQHRLADGAGRFVAHEGLDRQAPLRCGRDHAQVAQPFERHAERARDRCGGERQHVDLGAHRLDRLLVAHAETVFLVDHEQSEALELDLVADQLVGADDDVDRAVGDALERELDLLGGAKARQLGHLDRPLAEAVDDVLVVLFGQQRGRRQDRDLLAADHRDEGGAQRHLGLAEADIAAHQPVHRLRRDQVLDHGVDRGLLVRRLLEAEAGREGLVVVRPRSGAHGPRGRRAAHTGSSSSAAVSRTCSAALRRALSHWPEPSRCSGASSALTPV